MNYFLHPEALGDLRDAASFYFEQARPTLSQAFFGEFEQSINALRHRRSGFAAQQVFGQDWLCKSLFVGTLV